MSSEFMEIIQEKGNGKTLNAKLIAQRELHIEDATLQKALTFRIDIIALRNRSKQKIHIGWKWFVSGLAVLLATLLLPSIFSDFFAESLIKYSVYLVGVLSAAGLFYLAWKATALKHIFYTRNANVPVVELFSNNPTRKEFSAFVKTLEQCISDVQKKLSLSQKNQLAGEMKMLRRLSEEGVVNSSDYKKARDILLNMH